MVSTKLSLKFSGKKQDKSSKELEAFEDIADDVIESDFVPYACLFDPSTIATKDAELLQTIKITGLGYDGQSQGDLRNAIRAAIKRCIPDTSYAIWLHTLRRKQASAARAHFPDPLSGKIDEAWRAMQPSANAYVNELYVSIVRASEGCALGNPKVFKQSLLPGRDRVIRTEGMIQALAALTNTTQAMLSMLAPFGARLLTTVEREGIFYNEQVEFLEKLINLEERPMPVPERDLSHVLTSGEITFGFNAMEVRSADGHRRFAAILTLKEYKESNLKSIDNFLEIPCELIISQCFDFTGAKEAREAYEKQAKYLTYSDDKDLAKWIEIDRLMHNDDSSSLRAYGQQQTTIFLISPGVNPLEANVRMVQRALNKLGMIVVREDLRFEECYWSQLPANFPFISRKHSVDTDHVAGFVNLQAAPMGNALGSPWGPPVTLFTTVQDAPYHFNFHRQNSAHTVVLGNRGSGKTTFTHFLLAQARKLNPAIWYLDVRGRSAPFIQAMGGQVFRPGTPECMLNPLQLAETAANREFLALWLSTLIDPTGLHLNRSTLAYFQSVIDRILQIPKQHRRISVMVDIIRQDDGLLAASLQRYVAGGAYGELFDMPTDTFSVSKLCSWHIGPWMADPATRVPLTGYLLHRLTGMLNRTPTMLVLDEGFEIMDTPLFSARIGGWCDYLSQNNAALMMMTDAIDESALHPYSAAIMQRAATVFAMPDKAPESGYSMGFGFTPDDINTLSYMDASRRHVLQKRGGESVVIRAALAGMPQATLDILSGNVRPTISAADTLAELMGYNKQVV
jgi:type IV secretion system protein VirB4